MVGPAPAARWPSGVLGDVPLELVSRSRRPVLVISAPGGARMSTSVKRGLFATKPVDQLVADTKDESTQLARGVGLLDLTALGLGAIIGTGIFVILGEAIGDAGPAIVALVHPGRRHLRVLRAVLRRAGVRDPGLRQRLHLCVRDDGRAGGLDHRLGPDPRVRRVGGRGRGRLGPVLQRACSTRCSGSTLPDALARAAGRGRHGQPAGRVPGAGGDRAADLGRARAPGPTRSWC